MAKHDPETIIRDIETFLKANLNTQIASMNTEKSDSITLDTVSSDAYIIQSMSTQVANFNPFVFIRLFEDESDGIGPYTAENLLFDAVICFTVGQNEGEDTGYRLLRYLRIMKDLFEANFNKISGRFQFKVQALEPTSFQLVDGEQFSNDMYHAVGVRLSTAIA